LLLLKDIFFNEFVYQSNIYLLKINYHIFMSYIVLKFNWEKSCLQNFLYFEKNEKNEKKTLSKIFSITFQESFEIQFEIFFRNFIQW